MSILAPFLPKKETINYFFVLALEENQVRVAVAQIHEDKAKILGSGKSEFSDPEKETEAADIAVSMAEKHIPEDLLVDNVIFALPQYYLNGENVKDEYLARLKKIAKELELKAYGFVEYSTAITNYLMTVEGSAPTILILDMSKSMMTTTLVRIGKIIKNITTERTDSIVADFTKNLPEFEVEILPSRIIILDYGQKNFDAREELLKFPWHKHSIFLHTPKMEIFDNEKILTAIVEAAASSFLPNISQPMMDEPEVTEVIEEEKMEVKEKVSHAREKFHKFGFKEESIIEKTEHQKPEHNKKETTPVVTQPSAMRTILEKINFNRLKNLHFEFPHLPFLGILTFIAPLIIGILLLFFLIRNYPTASVYLLTYLQKSDSLVDIVFAREGSQIDGQNVIATKTVSDEITGSKSAKTTGANQIGEKAKGEVTVYNKQTSGKNLPKGTTIASGALKFTLDEEVKIASASETTEGITYGKTSVKVTASQIGPESNLPANSNFNFSDSSFSTLTAKNNLPLSGGTAKEIQAVSTEDRKNLENNLIKDLEAQAKQKMLKKLDVNGKLLDEPINTIISAKKFSHEVGSEAKELSLEMTLKVEGLQFNQEDLESKASVLNTTAPEGYKLDPKRINVKIASSKTNKNGDIEASLVISSYFIPEIDVDKIKEEIKGKTYNQAADFLEKQKDVAGVRIVPENKLPFFNNKLPILSKNINLVVTSK